MPGSFTLRPIEANLTHNTELIGKMSPYVKFRLGETVVQSEICKKGGKHPHWGDSVIMPSPIVPSTAKQPVLVVELMDKDKFTSDDVIGGTAIKLQDIETSGMISRWYPIYYNNKPAGEVLLETTFESVDLPIESTGLARETAIAETGFVQDSTISQTGFVAENVERKIFQEQQQIVEPHTFMKEVDVVETVPVKQTIEVMEPVKVIKDVEYTEAVPVTKVIETTVPEVVKKQVEVIEPRLVTKTIQVVENVPVMKEVEVIENKTVTKEVETLEPQTFTKQVEVTDYVPVTKEVEVSEPVHVKKAVEFVEPVITTKTITKEIPQTVIVNEEIKTEVGPATLIHEDKMILERNYEKKIIEGDIIESKIIKEDKLL